MTPPSAPTLTPSDDSGNVSGGGKDKPIVEMKPKSVSVGTATQQPPAKPKPEIKKPPRKSKLPEATFRTVRDASAGGSRERRFKKNGEEEEDEILEPMPSNGGTSTLPSLTSKRFKMLRLRKDAPLGDLGIVISKKRHPQKGTTGYIIAHIEESGLVER